MKFTLGVKRFREHVSFTDKEVSTIERQLFKTSYYDRRIVYKTDMRRRDSKVAASRFNREV